MPDHAQKPHQFYGEPDPAHPGWMSWELSGIPRFNSVLGKMIVQRDGDIARARIFPESVNTNLNDDIHGGVTLTLADIALFVGARLLGNSESDGGVTLDLSMQFMGAGKPGIPLDAEVELLRETGRMVFLRGIILQSQGIVAAFSGTLRKPTIRK